MAVNLLIRHKNSSGDTTSYTINIDGSIGVCSLDIIIKEFGNKVDNAYLIDNKEYRAKKGCHIRTVVDNSALLVQKTSKIENTIKTELPNDFYGKQFINVCRRIQRYANCGRIVVDKRKHISNNGRNTDLFDIIEMCNMTIDDFIIGYLSILQPYNIEYFQKGKEKDNANTWIVEMGYPIKLLIKIDERDKNKPIVVSFHESRIQKKDGGLTQQSGVKDFSDKPCAILINNCNNIAGTYVVSANLQMGFIRYSITTNAIACNNDVALVNYDNIIKEKNALLDAMFNKMANMYINNISIPELRFDNKDLHVSFSGRGYATINQLVMLIDMYSAYTDTNSIKILSEMAYNIIDEMVEDDRKYVLKALTNKYDTTPRNKMAALVYKELNK